MEPWSRELAGRLETLEIESDALRGNPLGDPHVRPLWVYTPPGYDDDPGRRYPSVYVIQGLTGQLDMWSNREAFRPTYPEAVDALFASEEVPPVIVVFVDCWTSLGGSQFLDSPGTGNYHTFLCDEVVPFVDERFRTAPERDRRGIQGKSSGGYGALVTPMLRPDRFSALASHAGDALFEACYLPEFRETVRTLREEYGGSYERFWEDFRSRPAFSKKEDGVLLNDWCMAACYSAEPDATVTLPFEVETGRLIPEVWERWLRWDPVRMAPRHADAIRSMRAIWLDGGTKDEWFLDNGAVAVSRELDKLGVEHTLELFDAGHMSIGYRYPLSLAFLARALSA
ncbi:MAG TPA: alpha/beta hydrolase-fold protein [Actinomycetota bacterium]|nr:alpha/beta hydrolase-fold protein [Actinomycetota bacterium]